jgi:hypothetical protein
MRKTMRALLMLSAVLAIALSSTAAWAAPVQLLAAVGPGETVKLSIINSDGSQSPFQIPEGCAFVVTDISIQRLSVVSGPGLFAVDLVQNIPSGGTINRWSFVGSIVENVERSFTSGIKFTTSFSIDNASSSADSVNVRLDGYYEKCSQ